MSEAEVRQTPNPVQTFEEAVAELRQRRYVVQLLPLGRRLFYGKPYDVRRPDGSNVSPLMTKDELVMWARSELARQTDQVSQTPGTAEVQDGSLAGIDGWLILAAIGITIAPLVPIGELLVFHLGGDAARAGTAVNLSMNVFDTLFAVIFLVQAILFYKKSRIFPWYFLVVNVVLCLLALTNPSPESIKTIVTAAIWVPYMFVSQRAKATFVR
jgi:Protein of unknown function (DUF2569)